jgi:hypothetical protein
MIVRWGVDTSSGIDLLPTHRLDELSFPTRLSVRSIRHHLKERTTDRSDISQLPREGSYHVRISERRCKSRQCR